MFIDNEALVFETVATALRTSYGSKNIFITGDELTSAPSSFPAVVLRKSSSQVNTRYSTFDDIETVVYETYYCTVYSNLETGKTKQCKEILAVVNDVMNELRYARSFEEQLFTIGRRLAKYTKNNVC